MNQPGLGSTVLAAATGLGVLLGGAGAADAASFGTLSNTANGGPTQELVNFNQFNSVLGTLTGVEIGLAGNVGGGSQFSITGAEGDSSGSTGFAAGLAVNLPNSSTLFSAAFSASASCTPGTGSQTNQSCNSGLQPTSPATFSPASSTLNQAADIADFIGAGLVALDALVASFTVDPPDCDLSVLGLGNCTPSNYITWSGTLTVTYFYTPTGGDEPLSINSIDVPGAAGAIPEPASIALLGFGLAGLGWARQRQRA